MFNIQQGVAIRIFYQYFDHVKPEIWQFHIGGYQVCQKWLGSKIEKGGC
ncbi:MAG: type ISP restriction/modification enzyme [Pseudomonadota bacterium]